MSDYWITFLAECAARATLSLLVTLPITYGGLWIFRRLGIIRDLGWPDPTNQQMFAIAAFVVVFCR